ncbi:MAG TPA: ABC transporter ATP-binding protein [Rhodopila sp.]|uniref:ABC transporter ATP-binding protein n=1 Tax=Rhodopila sp. TaxID=2480087 RepID=UPI002B7685FB|nr:ABC transporter ATP-binding protein [Rhodopila sp.]HVY16799.1 ABC transporter ATP-binding protein [Rhodopila sp.]
MAFARFIGIALRYGATPALQGLDLSTERGEIFCLLGASGSGKTTLLKIAGGFLAPDAGRVELDGQDITRLPPWQRPVNTMFQSYALFPHMTVAENIGFGLRRMGMRGAALKTRVAELLTLVRLDGFAERRIDTISGGQQQRVALARSLARRPKLLLLDEPFSALDRNLREETRTDLLRLLRDLDITSIIVTHDQEEALSSADRIGVLRAGRLEQVGTPAAVYEHPVNRYVAEFLGAATLLPGTVIGGADELVRIALNCGTEMVVRGNARAGERVLLGVRPENVVASATGSLVGVVETILYRGATQEITLRLPDGSVLRMARPVQRGALPPQPGARLHVAIPLDAGMLLRD